MTPTPEAMVETVALDAMMKTFRAVWHKGDDPDVALEGALVEVIRKHLAPVIAEAFERGAVFGRSAQTGICEAARRYGDTKVKQITEEAK